MRKSIAVAALAAFACLGAASARADFNDRAPITVTTTGSVPTGFFGVVVEALHAIYREAYPGSTVTLQPNSVGGGMLAIASGKADISIGLPPVEVQRGLAGQEPFKEPLQGKLFHVLTILNDLDFYFIASKDWAEKNKIRTFADFAKSKPRVRYGASNPATFYVNVVMDHIFKEYGYSFKDLEAWGGRTYYVASGTRLDDLRDGKIDAMSSAGLAPDRRVQEISKNMPLIWLKTDPDVLRKVAKDLDMQVIPIKAGTYDFLTEDSFTMRAPTVMAAGPHVPEETVYKIVKAIHENIDRFRAIHPTYAKITIEELARPSARLPYHPGAARYYREKGLLK
jgi:TRAP transporter TAXI family solute receptor